VERTPEGATPRYTRWLNELTQEQLMFQRFKECTVAMPTWFLHRSIFDAVGGFNEAGRGTPEDMDFFYAHLERGGQLVRVDQRLVLYRYHGDGASQSVTQDTIFQRRVGALQRQLLTHLDKFSIWGGKEARKLFNSLRGDLQSRVTAFLDIHPRKVAIAPHLAHRGRSALSMHSVVPRSPFCTGRQHSRPSTSRLSSASRQS